jgi:hypothetical protein
MKRLTVSAGALSLVLAAAACSQPDDGGRAATTVTVTATATTPTSRTSTTTTSSATTPTTPNDGGEIGTDAPVEISKTGAGREYLAIVRPFNAASQALQKEVRRSLPEFGPPSQAGFERLRPLSEKLADENRAFSLALLKKSERWPFDAAQTARTLAEESTKDQVYIRAMAKAKTRTSWQEAWNGWPDSDNSAELLRQQLGLPERS